MRSSVPLSHKLFAVIVAVATACGLYAFLRYRHAQFASAAALSFDSAAAQRLYSGIKLVPQPAVVFGQSVLNDTVVARFVPQADRAASSTAITIGEFRTRLELTQPNAGLLLVHYRDSDPGQAVAIANEVAEGLAAWTPSIAGTHAPAADALPAPTPILKPQLASNVSQDTLPAGPSLAAALAELKAQLSSADQRVSQESSLQSAHDRQGSRIPGARRPAKTRRSAQGVCPFRALTVARKPAWIRFSTRSPFSGHPPPGSTLPEPRKRSSAMNASNSIATSALSNKNARRLGAKKPPIRPL